MAQIKKRSEDTYQIIVFMGRDLEGKAINKVSTYHPKAMGSKAIEKEVQSYAVDFERRVKEGEVYEGDRITFMEFAKRWDEEWSSSHHTQSVREESWDSLRLWAFPYIGHMSLTKIRASHLQAIIQKMKKEGKKTATIKKKFSCISNVMRYAYKMDIIKENPCLRCEFPKSDQEEGLHYFTLDQAKTFLKALDQEYSFTYKAHQRSLDRTGTTWSVQDYQEIHRIGTQWKAYFTLAIFGGFRRGEMIALRWSDVDFEGRTISINKAVARTKAGQIIKDPKTKAGKRVVALPGQCFEILKTWKQEELGLCLSLGSEWKGSRGRDFDQNFIFIQTGSGEMMHLDSPRNRFVTILEMYNSKCENEEDRLPIIKLHDLRHTSATLMLAENVDIETVSHRLGHSKASVTLDVYGHALQTKDVEASEMLGALFA